MRFVCLGDVLPGKAEEAIQLGKDPKIPEGVTMRETLALMGDPCAVMVFEAPNEKVAFQFILQFSSVMKTKTMVAMPLDSL